MTKTTTTEPLEARLARVGKLAHACEEEQMLLVRDRAQTVRERVASHPALREAGQQRLATDRVVQVRWSLARNHALSASVQDVLARDDDLLVRLSLHLNPALQLSTDLPVPFLRDFALGMDLLEQSLKTTDPAVRSVLEPGWEGALTDLLAACASFAAELV